MTHSGQQNEAEVTKSHCRGHGYRARWRAGAGFEIYHKSFHLISTTGSAVEHNTLEVHLSLFKEFGLRWLTSLTVMSCNLDWQSVSLRNRLSDQDQHVGCSLGSTHVGKSEEVGWAKGRVSVQCAVRRGLSDHRGTAAGVAPQSCPNWGKGARPLSPRISWSLDDSHPGRLKRGNSLQP